MVGVKYNAKHWVCDIAKDKPVELSTKENSEKSAPRKISDGEKLDRKKNIWTDSGDICPGLIYCVTHDNSFFIMLSALSPGSCNIGCFRYERNGLHYGWAHS